MHVTSLRNLAPILHLRPVLAHGGAPVRRWGQKATPHDVPASHVLQPCNGDTLQLLLRRHEVLGQRN